MIEFIPVTFTLIGFIGVPLVLLIPTRFRLSLAWTRHLTWNSETSRHTMGDHHVDEMVSGYTAAAWNLGILI